MQKLSKAIFKDANKVHATSQKLPNLEDKDVFNG